MKKPIAITMGDPAGVGPEIILKSFLNSKVREIPLVVLGDYKVLDYYKKELDLTDYELNRIDKDEDIDLNGNMLNIIDFANVDMEEFTPGKLAAMCGQAAYEYVTTSIDMVKKGKARAVTTAPLNKEALHLSGHNFPGHTEIFAKNCESNDFAMLLYDKKLSIIHVSTHVSLMDAINNLSQERISNVIGLADLNMRKILGRKPRIAVAGINPHSSENGLFGNQESQIIKPVIEKMAEKINVVGPIPPDTVFYRGVNGEYDIVVAMYHDQGHIPFKMYAFESGVNTSVGLPIVRTSVDHGTAFDIACKGIASSKSIENAIILADKLTNDIC